MANRYFVSYYPYSKWIDRIAVLVGETTKYYKVQSTKNPSVMYLINKNTGCLRGSNVKYHEMSEKLLTITLRRQKTIRFLQNVDFDDLTNEQLERIRKIVGESNEIQSID